MRNQIATALSLVDSFPPAPKLPRATTSVPPSRGHDTNEIDEGWAIERYSYITERSPLTEAANPAEELEPTRKEAVSVAPATDTFRGASATFLHIDAPGIQAEDMTLTLVDDVLVYRAERRAWSGSSPMVYSRQFAVSREMDRDGIEATLKHGVLSVRIPDANRQATRIEVRNVHELRDDDLEESEELVLPLPEYDIEV